jgi:predicted  nucleic acid-binding Zn-ribbon protein
MFAHICLNCGNCWSSKDDNPARCSKCGNVKWDLIPKRKQPPLKYKGTMPTAGYIHTGKTIMRVSRVQRMN